MIGAETNSPKFFIHFGKLVYTVFVLYVVWSAISVTIKYVYIYGSCRRDPYVAHESLEEESLLHDEPSDCCGIQANSLSWYQKIQWFLFTVGAEMSLASTFIYWALVHRANEGFSKPNYANTIVIIHLVNALVAIFDVWLTNIPIRILHGAYMIFFSGSYQLFTGVYYAVNGTDIMNNNRVSPILNYNSEPGIAIIMDYVIPLVIVPAVHMFFFLQYVLRSSLLYIIHSRCLRPQPLSEMSPPDIIDSELPATHERTS